jgi:hypothetical protein
MGATERIPVLLTREQKARLVKRAKAVNLTMGEYVRRAAEAYDPQADDKALEGLIQRVRESAEQAGRAMDEALASVSKSQQRVADMEAAHAARKSA